MKTDTLFYHLFQTLPEVVFELAGLEEPDGRSYRFRSEERVRARLIALA